MTLPFIKEKNMTLSRLKKEYNIGIWDFASSVIFELSFDFFL